VQFRDRFSVIEGHGDLAAHTGAAQRFMPGLRIERKGGIRHCQGTILADWVALAANGEERMSGTHVFVLALSGRISSVTGFLNPSPKTK
jgi:hypothetical protein